MRRATCRIILIDRLCMYFYPRSPCGERPAPQSCPTCCAGYFYPRSPCGERLWANFSGFYWWVISIHALLAESDSLNLPSKPIDKNISIHALLAESDRIKQAGREHHRHFYPRSPCGERPRSLTFVDCAAVFLSTLSLRRATPFGLLEQLCVEFLSTLSLRRATMSF